MTHQEIATRRLRNQRITSPGLRTPEDVVQWFGAVQAQEFEPAKWGLGLRMRSATSAIVEQAFNEGRLLRTHAMRPTWHFVAAADIRWVQALTGGRVKRMMHSYNQKLGLDARTFTKSLQVMSTALRDGQSLTRLEIAERLIRAGIPARGSRLAHMMMHAELECLVCSGPRRGKSFTYALVDHRAPGATVLPADEALATLVTRYFQSHGPATVRDCAWWSGLTMKEIRRGLDIVGARRILSGGLDYWTVGQIARSPARDHLAHLLPIYDEYVVAYRDRVAVPHTSAPKGIVFQHALIIDGQLAGTWRKGRTPSGAPVVPTAVRPLTASERLAVGEAVERHHRFVR